MTAKYNENVSSLRIYIWSYDTFKCAQSFPMTLYEQNFEKNKQTYKIFICNYGLSLYSQITPLYLSRFLSVNMHSMIER